MPVVLASIRGEGVHGADSEQVLILFPTRDKHAPGGWQWDEVTVEQSAIQGFGLKTSFKNHSEVHIQIHLCRIGSRSSGYLFR